MIDRAYDGLVLDLDGTVLDDSSRVHPRTRAAIDAARAAGVRVLVATGRSSVSAAPVLEELGLDCPAVVFNGAALYCPKTKRMLEERVLGNRTRERAIEFGLQRAYPVVVMCADKKLAMRPRDDDEAAAMKGMTALEFVDDVRELSAEYVIRVTYFGRGGTSEALARDVEEWIDLPVYVTHFPLSVLPSHRESPMNVVDLHPPCRGKAEALRVMEELYGIPPARVVAVGDATNDIPMFELAGLSVAMGDGMREARAVARRVIDGCNGTALAELVEELFLARA